MCRVTLLALKRVRGALNEYWSSSLFVQGMQVDMGLRAPPTLRGCVWNVV